MSSKWNREAITDRMYRQITSTEYKVDDHHHVLIMRRDGNHEAYVMTIDDNGTETGFTLMFGVRISDMPYHRLVDCAFRDAMNYSYNEEE